MRDDEAAMKAALERTRGPIDLCTLHAPGFFDRDLCAFDFELFGIAFRVRGDEINSYKLAGFAARGA